MGKSELPQCQASHRKLAENKKYIQNFGLDTFLKVVTWKFNMVERQNEITVRQIRSEDVMGSNGSERMVHL
jgi:hypothetical protein